MEEEWEIIGPEEEEDWEIEDQYDPNLAGIRSSFTSELENPEVRQLLLASKQAEVGGQEPHYHKAYMETVFNRAAARGMSLTDTVLDPDYYPSITHQRMSGMMGNFQDEEMQQLDTMIDEVVKGSNISNYATGNESMDVHSGGAPVSYNPSGEYEGPNERFVQENDDLGWVKKTQTDAQEDWEIILPSTKGKLTEAPSKDEEWEIIPPAGKKSWFATEEEEKKWGGRGPKDPTRMAEEAAQFDTKLTKTEELDFQKWKAKYAPKDSGVDYDLRGAFKAGFTPDPKTGHWSDKYKKPNHPTFSDQSQYATAEYAAKAGHWEGDKFVPADQATKGTANRKELQGAIAKAEKEGYTVPHFIGMKDEPEGDRAPTRDMEQLVGALATQEHNAIRARDLKTAAKISKERSYWENKIKTEGMSAEQWKKQTGEEDPRYPHEPAFSAKQSAPELIDSVESGINAGKEVWESAKRGLMSSGLGLGETINRYAYSPIIHGIREAIDYVAPGSALAKTAKFVDDEFYKHTVEIPAAQRAQLGKESAKAGFAGEVGHAVGTMAGDLPTIMLTGGLLPELKTGMELVNSLRHGAAAMTIPAMRAGTDAAEQVKKNGGGEMEQFGAFIRGTTLMMGIGAVPMATKSGAASIAGRVAERVVKSVPLASAAVESARMADNLVSDIFGGEKHPFSIEEHIKGVLPMAILGGVAGRNVAKSKFEKTFGFNERNLDKADFMRRRMEAEGLAKATPEKVMEWEGQWKKQEGQWLEEAPPATPEESFAPKEEAPPAAPITPIYRQGRAEGNWWSESKDYAQSFGKKAAVQSAVLPADAKILDVTDPKVLRSLATSEEYKAMGSNDPAVARQANIDLLTRTGHDALTHLDEDAEGNLQKSYFLKEPPPKAEPGPVSVKRSAQALGIVADPRAAKGFEAAREEAKNIADYLNKAEHWGPWNSAIGNFVASGQKAQDNAMRMREALRKEAPDALGRKGITMNQEAGGDRAKLVGWGANVKDAEAKEAYRAAGALKPNELSVQNRIDEIFKAARMELNNWGIDVAERDNYITHMLHTRGLDPKTGAPARSVSSFFKYAKARTYDNFFQAFQAGEKPKTLDAVDIVTGYWLVKERAINNEKLIRRLKFGQARDGDPILAPDTMEWKAKGYDTVKAPGLDHLVVHPDHAGDLAKILGRSKLDEWLNERTRNPFLNIGKGVLQTAIEAQKYMKGTMFSFSFFHQLTEGTHALGHRVNPFNIKTKEIDLNDPEQFDAAKHGLMLRPDRTSMDQFMEGVSAEYNLVTKFGRKFGGDAGKRMADMIDGYTHYLFESYIPRLKMDTYRHIVERNMGRFAKDLESGKVSPSEVKSLSADQANAAYGHLNYTKMARSATARQLSQIIFLAPDFFEARAKFAAQAGKGAVGLLTGSKTGTEQLIALAVLGIGQYAIARILNQLDHGDYEWDPEHAFQVKTDLGGILPDKRWVGLRSVPEDIHKAMPIIGDPGQFIQNRLSPFSRLASESVFKTNWRHEKTNFSKALTDMVANVVPMPLQGVTGKFFRPDRAESLSKGEMFLKSTGIQIHRVSPIMEAFQMADEWNEANDPQTFKRSQESAFPESKYRSLRYAIEDGDKEFARTEVKRLAKEDKVTEKDVAKGFAQSTLRSFTKSQANDQRLYESLNKHDREIFNSALKRRALILERYRAWIGPLKGITTEETIHKKMREAKSKEMKKRLKEGLETEE